MVKTYTIESVDHRARMSEHEDGRWVAKADYDALAATLFAAQQAVLTEGLARDALAASVDRLTSDKARLAAELGEARNDLRLYGGNGAAAILELVAVRREKRELAAELEQAKARVIELSDMKPATLRQRVQDLEAALSDLTYLHPDSNKWATAREHARTLVGSEPETKVDQSTKGE